MMESCISVSKIDVNFWLLAAQLEMEEDDFGSDAISSENEDSEESIIEALERETTETVKRRNSEEYNVNQKKHKTFNSIQPPTVQELNQLRETENLFNSSLFRMQIEEMLKETQMKAKYHSLFIIWLDEFKSFVFKLKSTEEYDLTDNSWLQNMTVKPPVVLKPESDKGKFKFLCPEDITVGGSYSIKACLGPLYTVDLHVHVPVDCFQKSDQLNLRFDRKRAFYLTILAEALINCSLVEEANFVHGNGCILKPLLELKPAGKLGRHIRVLLWPVTNPDVILITRLRPGRGNVRSHWYRGTPNSEVSDHIEPPSPHYNSGVAHDLIWRQNQEMLECELCTPSLQEGLILLKIWLRQRHLDKGYGSFGGFIMAMYLVYLLQNKRLNKMMSSYQVARVTWNCLAQSDWATDGISLSSASNGPTMSDFQQHFGVVFIDASGICNLCANLREEIYMQVKTASAQAVALLDASVSNSFQALFMMPVNFEHSVDDVIRLHDMSPLVKTVQNCCTPEQQLVHVGWIMPQLLNLILPFLKRGLGQRVTSIIVQPSKIERWACSDAPPSPTHISVPLLFGLCLNPSQAFETLERGPAADQLEAAEFRAFWGDLSQLRRFRDGSICEAVMWSSCASACQQVVHHVLKRHVGLDQYSYLYISNLPDGMLKLPPEVFHENIPQGDAAFQKIIVSFDSLTKQLRSLPDMTLSVNTVLGISPVFRYADVFPPLSIQLVPKSWLAKRDKCFGSSIILLEPGEKVTKILVPRYCAPVEAVMTLEHSGKWPKNLEAVRRLKAAFCIQMATALEKECGIPTQVHVDHVDAYKDGFVFRIWLAALKEVSLMKQRIGASGLVAYHDTPETIALEEKLVLLPKISSSLHGLYQQFPGFGPTARLAKRWLSSLLLGPPHIPDLVTELIVAYIFISPEPFHRPVQPQLGLLHFLRLVSTTDWLTVPLIVNLNSEFTREQIAELETRFHSSRKSLPPLFLATPYDRSVSQSTRTSPSLQMLIRLGSLASEALKELKIQLLESTRPDCVPIFRPNLADYDVIINLKTNWISRIHENIDQLQDNLMRPCNYVSEKNEKVPIVDFDPVQHYLTELREGFSSCALFFHDQYGGNVIGVVWKPLIALEKDFKVSVVHCHKPTKKSKLSLNIDSVLEDFQIIGQGLVKSIENKTGKKDDDPHITGNDIT